MARKISEERWVLMTELNGEPLLHHFKLSNLGNVVRIRKGAGPEEPFNPKEIGGYKYISFTTLEGSRETIYLHRLVAEFFVENGDEDNTYVIHKDYNRRNNRFDNLEWVPQSVLYKHRARKAGRTPGAAKNKIQSLPQTGNLSEEAAKHTNALLRQHTELLGTHA